MVNYGTWLRIQEGRRKSVQNICTRSGHIPKLKPENMNNIYVDDKHKLLYCAIPKVACTNWFRVFLVLTGKVNHTRTSDIPASDVHNIYSDQLTRLSSFNKREIKYRLKNYLKFMFVRNPFERMLSAYRNKFVSQWNKYFPARYGRYIIRQYRKNATQQAIQSGSDVKFKEFVQYIIDPRTEIREPANEHWKQFYKLCHPCLVDYNVIGKYDTMTQDIKYLFKQAMVEKIVKFPSSSLHYHGARTAQFLIDSFEDISKEEIRRLWQFYSVDFAMFGYPFPSWAFTNTTEPTKH